MTATRRLTAEQLREAVPLRTAGESLRVIAKRFGVSYSGTRTDLAGVVPDRVVGQDGKSYPATRGRRKGPRAGLSPTDDDRWRRIGEGLHAIGSLMHEAANPDADPEFAASLLDHAARDARATSYALEQLARSVRRG